MIEEMTAGLKLAREKLQESNDLVVASMEEVDRGKAMLMMQEAAKMLHYWNGYQKAIFDLMENIAAREVREMDARRAVKDGELRMVSDG